MSLQVIRHERQEYAEALLEQETLVAQILSGERSDTLILTEHPPVFTLGTSASASDVLAREIDGEAIAVLPTGRGGEVTYHGPGQLVCYVLADIRAEADLHRHVWRLEEMIIRTLADLGVPAERSERGIGVWVEGRKIAAVGVRCRKWVTFHGVALNIAPNLKHFSGIVPCGMRDAPVVSLQALGVSVARPVVETGIIAHANTLFARAQAVSEAP